MARSLSNAVVQYSDSIQANLGHSDDYTLNVSDTSVSVAVKSAGFFHAMVWEEESAIALSEFTSLNNATYAELLEVEPLLADAKVLLIKIHKELVNVIADTGRTEYSVQDVQRILEGEGEGPSIG